jgi:hypothetical protein
MRTCSMILNLLWKNCSLLITEEKEISNFSARIFVYENVRIRLFAIVYFLILPFHAFSQKVSVSLLASSEIKRETPYQIKEIIDLRNSKNKIGDVFGENRKPQEVVFQGNLISWLCGFLKIALGHLNRGFRQFRPGFYNWIYMKNRLRVGIFMKVKFS